MRPASPAPPFTLRVTREGCCFSDGASESRVTRPWVTLGFSALGPAAITVGHSAEELRERLEEALVELEASQPAMHRPRWWQRFCLWRRGEQPSPSPPRLSPPRLIGLGEDAFWDRQWRGSSPGGLASWLARAPAASKERWLVADALSKESFRLRWAREVVLHCLREHAPPKKSRRAAPLRLEFAGDFTAEERRGLRGAALVGWQGRVSGRDDTRLQLAAEWLALRFGWVVASSWLLSASLTVVDGPARLWNAVLEWSWPMGFLLSLLLLFEPARRARMTSLGWAPWLMGICGLCLTLGVVPGIALWANALAAPRGAISVLAGPVTQPCPEHASGSECSVSFRDEPSGRIWTLEVHGPWGRGLRRGQELFFCFRRGALGEPFVWVWEDMPAACQAERRRWRACCADP